MKWLWKLSMIGLLLCLISLSLHGEERTVENYPTEQQIDQLYINDHALVISMIRKLYWIEKTPLYVEPPQYTAILMKNGDLLLQSDQEAEAKVDNLLKYKIEYPDITIKHFVVPRKNDVFSVGLYGFLAGSVVTLITVLLIK